MAIYSGVLHKMAAQLADPIAYSLRLGEQQIPLNEYLGQPVRLTFTGKLFCVHCGRKTTKSFQQGYCFVCYRRLLECNLCVIHPERCRVEAGGCPAHDWAHAQCDAPHVVYLANASGLKIGITRETQVPTRWIDQGAIQALPLFQVGNRYRAGVVEVAFKDEVDDKTNWRIMLQNRAPTLDLPAARDDLLERLKTRLEALRMELGEALTPMPTKIVELQYPVQQYPSKINSLSLDRQPEVSGQLLGIKGQYLLLDHGVINLRRYSGYELAVELPD